MVHGSAAVPSPPSMPLPRIPPCPAPEIHPSSPRTFHRCYAVIPSTGMDGTRHLHPHDQQARRGSRPDARRWRPCSAPIPSGQPRISRITPDLPLPISASRGRLPWSLCMYASACPSPLIYNSQYLHPHRDDDAQPPATALPAPVPHPARCDRTAAPGPHSNEIAAPPAPLAMPP